MKQGKRVIAALIAVGLLAAQGAEICMAAEADGIYVADLAEEPLELAGEAVLSDEDLILLEEDADGSAYANLAQETEAASGQDLPVSLVEGIEVVELPGTEEAVAAEPVTEAPAETADGAEQEVSTEAEAPIETEAAATEREVSVEAAAPIESEAAEPEAPAEPETAVSEAAPSVETEATAGEPEVPAETEMAVSEEEPPVETEAAAGEPEAPTETEVAAANAEAPVGTEAAAGSDSATEPASEPEASAEAAMEEQELQGAVQPEEPVMVQELGEEQAELPEVAELAEETEASALLETAIADPVELIEEEKESESEFIVMEEEFAGTLDEVAELNASGDLYTVSGTTITPSVTAGKDATEAVNAALKAADELADSLGKQVTVAVPKGSYKLTDALHIFNNTTLNLTGVTFSFSGNESFNMLISGTAGTYKGITNYNASSKCSGYIGFKNITVNGGTFASANANECSIIRLMHATNVTLNGVTVKGGGCSHQVELAAIDGLYVKNCTFQDFGKSASDVDNDENMEALQLDIPCKEFVYPGAYQDGTTFRNVEITGCTFKNVPRGVGTHTMLIGAYHENIKINNNTFNNVLEECIIALNYDNCEIKNNTINNCGGGILVQNGKSTDYSINTTIFDGKKAYQGAVRYNVHTVISGNKIKIKYRPTCKDEEGVKVFGYNWVKSVKGGDGKAIPAGNYYISGVTVTDNTITTSGTGIHLLDARDCTVANNTVTGSGFSSSDPEKNEHDGIFIDLGSKNVTVTGNTVSGMTRNGLLVQESQLSSVTGNSFTSCVGKGINFYNGSGCAGELSKNTVKNCGGGILVSTKSTVASIKKNKISSDAKKQDETNRGIMVYSGSTVSGSISGNTLTGIPDTAISISEKSTVKGSISGNTISGAKRNGIEVIQSSKVKKAITGNTLTSTANVGIVLQEKSSVAEISKNTVTKCTAYGIKLLNSCTTSAVISDNKLTNCGGGIMLSQKCTAKSISGNTISGDSGKGSSNRGIVLYSSCTLSGSISGNTVTGIPDTAICISDKSTVKGDISSNTISGAKRNGIEVIQSSKVKKAITGNTLTSTANVGIVLQEKSSVAEISNNTVTKCTAYGIKLLNSCATSAVISGNKLTNCGGGIMLSQKCTAKSISGNTIFGDSGKGSSNRGIVIYSSCTLSGSVEKNRIKNPADSGIVISEKSTVKGNISGNTVQNAKRTGIEIMNSSKVSGEIRSNKVSGSKAKGISVVSKSTVGKAIRSNTVTGSKGHGISLYSISNNVTVASNIVTGGSDHCIMVNPSNTKYTVTLKGNTVQGTSKVTGIRVQSGKIVVADNAISSVLVGIFANNGVKGNIYENTYGKKVTNKIFSTKYCSPGSKVKGVSGKAESSKTKATVKWKKVSGASGYEVQYSLKSDFSSGVKSKTASSSGKSVSLTGLKKAKTYYVRVASYQSYGGVKVYGAYGTGSFSTK